MAFSTFNTLNSIINKTNNPISRITSMFTPVLVDTILSVSSYSCSINLFQDTVQKLPYLYSAYSGTSNTFITVNGNLVQTSSYTNSLITGFATGSVYNSNVCFTYNNLFYIFIFTNTGYITTRVAYPNSNYNANTWTWTISPSPILSVLSGLCCSTSGSIMYAIISSSPSVLTYSKDQGSTWTSAPGISLTAFTSTKNGLACSSDGTKIFAGNSSNTGNSYIITVSNISGTPSFTITSNPPINWCNGSTQYLCTSCYDSTMTYMCIPGFISGDSPANSLSLNYTTDGGTTFTSVTNTNFYNSTANSSAYKTTCSKSGKYMFAIAINSLISGFVTNTIYYTTNGNTANPTWNTTLLSYPVASVINSDIRISSDASYIYIFTTNGTNMYLFYATTGYLDSS